jgi:hypothetical protein
MRQYAADDFDVIGQRINDLKRSPDAAVEAVSDVWYLGLTKIPGVEIEGGGYERQPITFVKHSGCPIPCFMNGNSITYTASGSDWGVITGVAIYKTRTGGPPLESGALVFYVSACDGDTLQFNVGSIPIFYDTEKEGSRVFENKEQ